MEHPGKVGINHQFPLKAWAVNFSLLLSSDKPGPGLGWVMGGEQRGAGEGGWG